MDSELWNWTGGTEKEGRRENGKLVLHHGDSEQPVSRLELCAGLRAGLRRLLFWALPAGAGEC